MEARFGRDFSQVSVHTDERAASSANAVRALAYTVGQHIAFGAGQYRPHTADGQRLLAHELTHTLQQRPADSLHRQAAAGDDPVTPDSGSPRALWLLQVFQKNRSAFTQLDGGIFKASASDGVTNVVETAHVKDGGIPWTFTFVSNAKAGTLYVRQQQDGTAIVNYRQGALPISAGGTAHLRDPEPCPDLMLPVVTDTTRWRVTEVPPGLVDVPAVPYAPVAAAITNTTDGISAITKRGSAGALGHYTYAFTFCLCEGFSNPVLAITFATDNDSELLLNGNVIATRPPDLTAATLVTGAAQAGFFVGGANTLTCRVRNRGTGEHGDEKTVTGMGMNGTLTAKNGQCY